MLLHEIYSNIVAKQAPSCFLGGPETFCIATVRKCQTGFVWSVLALSPFMPCSCMQTFAALLLYFPWKGECLPGWFSGTAWGISHVGTTWHYKEFAEEVVLWMKTETLLEKLPLMSWSYGPVFIKFVSFQFSLHSSFNPLSDAFFSGFTEMTKKTTLFFIKYQEHCRKNGIIQKQLTVCHVPLSFSDFNEWSILHFCWLLQHWNC